MDIPKETIQLLNFEITTKCPLHCKQCYCSLEGGRNMPLETAEYWVDQAADYGVKTINISGGETLCYPYLFELISYISQRNITSNIAISGVGFNELVLNKLVDSGVGGIFVSLNGSTEEINKESRDGYHFAVNALKILSESTFRNTTVNWVMQSTNSYDFPNFISFIESFCIERIVVIALKPDSSRELKKIPTVKQMHFVSDIIRRYKGKVQLCIESCYSPLLALTLDSFLFGSQNTGIEKGCLAGYTNASVNVDGLLSPCRHLEYYERYSSLKDYWENSPVLAKIRNAEAEKQEPCLSCKYENNCRHCLAINSKLHNKIYIGNSSCPLAENII